MQKKNQLQCLVVLFTSFVYVAGSIRLPTIQWNFHNPFFKKGKCNPEGKYVHLYADIASVIVFSCTLESQLGWVSKTKPPMDVLDNIYIVSEKEFNACAVKKITRTTKRLLTCSEYNKENFYTLELRPQAPSTADLSYKVNKTYYFIATSNGTKESLDSMSGGRCTQGMRMALTICPMGSKCGSDENRCSGVPTPKPRTTTTIPTTTLKPKTTTTKKSVNIDEPRENKTLGNPVPFIPVTPGTAPVKSGDPDRTGSSESSTVVFVIGFLAAFLIGFGLGLFAVMVYQKKYPRNGRPPSDSSSMDDRSDVFRQNKHPASDTPNTELNRKYFNNDVFRNSTEFKRLLSTSSSISSNNTIERHSVTPVGEYAS